MRGVISVLALLLGPHVAMAQERASDPVSAAMAALNVVLPREAEQELALSAAPAHLRAGAAVYVYGTRGFERVRTGSNG
ncbi:MAG: hypothetical protein IBJ19_16590, partial [Gemmatimonadaceae bacterium]|nr:hypothetical protein [Gemmatimonadaceae bacterium]